MTLKFAQGTYTGDGTTSQAITGLLFTPKMVIVVKTAGAGAEEPLVRATGMSAARYIGAMATTTAGILSLDAGGFTVRQGGSPAGANANVSGMTYQWMAWGGDEFVVGTYTGNGGTQSITGVGGQPEMVGIIWGQNTPLRYTTTEAVAAGATLCWGDNTVAEADVIVSLDADGFSLGSNTHSASTGAPGVNRNAVSYVYFAILAAPNFAHGSYTGNFADNRNLPATPIAFDPDAVIIKGASNTQARGKQSSLGGDAAYQFSTSGAVANSIQSLTPAVGQFQVGTATDANATGVVFYWIAFEVKTGGPIDLAGSIDSTAVLSAALTVILGPDSLVAIQKRGVMRSGIWVVGQSPPFPLIREIRTAVNVDRIKPLDEPGRLSFDISPREGEAAHDYASAGGSNMGDGLYLPPDLIREGTFLVDFSSELVEPWLWYIQTIAYDSDKASVQAVEVRGLLGERTLPEGSSFSSKGAAAVANVLLAQANGRNPTYIVPGSSSALRVVIPTGQATDFSRQNVLSAFDALAAFAAGDWWVSYAVSRSGIRPTLQFGKRGSDRTGEVILTEGIELRAVSYARDAREVPRFVRFVQDSQGPAGGMATESAVGYRTGGQVQLAPEFHLRRALRKHGPALSAEQLRVYPQNTTDITLVGAALRSLQTSEAAVQTVELTLRQPPERFDVNGEPLAQPQPRTPWSAFGLGDTVTVRLSSPQFFAGADVTLRITALQPDEAAGEMILVGDIVA